MGVVLQNKNAEFKFCAPLTSFDWNEFNPKYASKRASEQTAEP